MLFPFICAVHISITLPYESSDTFVLISGFYYYYYYYYYFFYLGRGFLLIIIFFIVFIIILLLLIFFFFSFFPFLVTAFAPLETEDSKKKKKNGTDVRWLQRMTHTRTTKVSTKNAH